MKHHIRSQHPTNGYSWSAIHTPNLPGSNTAPRLPCNQREGILNRQHHICLQTFQVEWDEMIGKAIHPESR